MTPDVALAGVGGFGSVVGGVGDVNGDGYADLGAGIPANGTVALYFGGPGGFPQMSSTTRTGGTTFGASLARLVRAGRRRPRK